MRSNHHNYFMENKAHLKLISQKQNRDRFNVRGWSIPDERMLNHQELLEWGKHNFNMNAFTSLFFILMQCTSIKDRNSELIFEGDIIKTPLPHDIYRDYAYYEIVWCNKGTGLYQKCVGLHHKTNGWMEARDIIADEWDYYSFEYYIHKNIKIEIIGNIFKNPELLKK